MNYFRVLVGLGLGLAFAGLAPALAQTKAEPKAATSSSAKATKIVSTAATKAASHTAKAAANSHSNAKPVPARPTTGHLPAKPLHRAGAARSAGRPGAQAKPAGKASSRTASSPAIVSSDGKPIWLDIKSARIAARVRHRPILADFYTEWCHWCKVMDKTTLQDKQIQDYLARNYVCTRLDAQDGGSGEDIATRFAVHYFPTYMIFDSTGKPVYEFDGFKRPPQFLSELGKGLFAAAKELADRRAAAKSSATTKAKAGNKSGTTAKTRKATKASSTTKPSTAGKPNSSAIRSTVSRRSSAAESSTAKQAGKTGNSGGRPAPQAN